MEATTWNDNRRHECFVLEETCDNVNAMVMMIDGSIKIARKGRG